MSSGSGLRVFSVDTMMRAWWQRVRVVLGQVIGHARQARVHVGAAEILGA